MPNPKRKPVLHKMDKCYPLIETEQLSELINSGEKVHIVDFTLNIGERGKPKANHFEKRIPGAKFLDPFEASDETSNVMLMFPKTNRWRSLMSRLEIPNDNSAVVVYDQDGLFGGARGWFLFKSFGRKNVRFLNGGLPKWEAEDRPTESGEYQVEDVDMNQEHYNTYKKDRSQYATYEEIISASDHILENAENAQKVIVDSREADWFNGNPGPGGKPGGSIGGSINVPWKSLLNEDRTFKSVEETQELLTGAKADLTGTKQTITTCSAGVTACTMILAHHMCGNYNTALYDDSWTGWLQKHPDGTR